MFKTKSKKDFTSCIVKENDSIEIVLNAMNENSYGICLVVNQGDKYTGTLTDGDIRRAILSGAKLTSEIKEFVCTNSHFVSPDTKRADVLDLMQAKSLKHIPIVCSDGFLTGLHTIHEIIGHKTRSNWSVIMAGGKGVRLRPLTENLPKPMIKIAGRPILERLILHLISFGFENIFLSINYLGHVIEDYFEDGSKFGCNIKYLREKEPLGTGGALSLLPEVPTEDIFVMNGDLVTQVNFDEMLRFHKRDSFDATIGAHRYFHTVPYGCLDSNDNVLTAISEKPTIEKLVNAGIYVLSPDIIKEIPSSYFPLTELFNMQNKSKKIGIYEIHDDWIDVGEHEQLNNARYGVS
jgi:dTDP-glucose pyrophosphorylase